MALIEALAGIGAIAVAVIVSWLVCFLKLSPWSSSNRDHAVNVRNLPYPLYAFGCWSRAFGSWLYSLIPSPMLAVDMASRFLQSQVLFAVVNLGIPDALQEHGPSTASELAAACHCPNIEHLDRLLRAAAVLGILSKTKAEAGRNKECASTEAPGTAGMDMFSAAGENQYYLNSLSACLCKNHKSSVAAMVKLYAYNYESAASLCKSLQNGQTSHELQTGQSFWSQLAGDATKGAVFDEAMHCFKDLGGWSVVSGHNWGQYDALIDIAGGNGSFVAMLLAAYPHLTGTVMDQKDQVVRGEQWWQLHHPDLQPRVTFKAGDMLQPSTIPAPPPGPGRVVYILRNILHNWGDLQALAILKSVRAAIKSGDITRVKLLIIELTSSTGGMPPLLEPRLLADIQMLTLFGSGKERNQQQFAAMLHMAGFRLRCCTPTTGLLMVLEAEPF